MQQAALETDAPAARKTSMLQRFIADNQFLLCIVGAWLVLNLSLNFFNKAALGRHTEFHFTYPLFYTACHQMASFTFSNILFYFRPELNTLSYSGFRQNRGKLLILGLCFYLNLACNNASLVYLPLSINGVIKSTSPLPTMVLSCAIEGKRYPLPMIMAVLGMVAAAVISIPFGDEDNASLVGLLLVATSTLSLSTRPVLSSILMADADSGLTPFVLVWYDSAISCGLLLATSLIFELQGLIAYFTLTPWRGLGILALSSTMAFACALPDAAARSRRPAVSPAPRLIAAHHGPWLLIAPPSSTQRPPT